MLEVTGPGDVRCEKPEKYRRVVLREREHRLVRARRAGGGKVIQAVWSADEFRPCPRC